MRIDFLTIFPEMLPPVLNEGMLRIAREKGKAAFHVHDLRDWSGNRHRKIDDKPFGGGPGMVIRAEPVASALSSIRAEGGTPGRLVFLTPRGAPFGQRKARELAREQRLVLVAGRYEGFDARLYEALEPEEISIGDYVLTGGELPALVVADAVVRLLPGGLGSAGGLENESFDGSRLDYPHYTQPAEWRGRHVPEVLRSGDHARIEAWRREQARRRTEDFRPDLLGGAE